MAAGHGRLASITEAGLALFLLSVNKVLFHPVFDHTLFLGDSNTKMQWAAVCRFLPIVDNICSLLNTDFMLIFRIYFVGNNNGIIQNKARLLQNLDKNPRA